MCLEISFLVVLSLTDFASGQSVVFEAEDFSSATNWNVESAADASDGEFAVNTAHTFNDRTLSPASYDLNIPAAGVYSLYVRAYVTAVDPDPSRMAAGADQNDSFFIFDGFNGSPSTTLTAFQERVNELFFNVSVGGIGVEQWGWINASAGLSVDNPIAGVLDTPGYTYEALATGPQVFNIAGREDGLYLDVFVLSTETDLASAQLNALANIVPEPGSMALVLTGLFGFARATRHFRRCWRLV